MREMELYKREDGLPAVVQHLLDRSGSSVSVEIHDSEGRHTIAGGKYSLAQHKITLYWDGIQEQCRTLYGSLKPFEQHLAAVFAHELGHAEDRELEELADQLDCTDDLLEKKRIALRIETNAWSYASRLLQEDNSEFLHFLMHMSLEPYHDGAA
ncbi:hypothetical protein M3221_14775 [Domibacillus indicus]|uniref:hypothetical protein n=1 Tax=Domibacillus indicus TaxID=1437523 RepID=UPI00203F85C8|nr:hypothetical protein [Domibacillus indicus]MCM3789661.1 hypothetical protein [Domibacillus indicus]